MASNEAQIKLDKLGVTSELTDEMFKILWDKKLQLGDSDYWEIIFWLRCKITKLEHPEWYTKQS
jgi:hypothetical protein